MELKLPLKIKIFFWYLGRGVTLTNKDNLIKRNCHYWKKALRHRLNRALDTGFSNRHPETETKGSWL
jgi:hypothetical protein